MVMLSSNCVPSAVFALQVKLVPFKPMLMSRASVKLLVSFATLRGTSDSHSILGTSVSLMVQVKVPGMPEISGVSSTVITRAEAKKEIVDLWSNT